MSLQCHHRGRTAILGLLALAVLVEGHGHMSTPAARSPQWLTKYDDGQDVGPYRLDEPVYNLQGPMLHSNHQYSANAFRCHEHRPAVPTEELVAGTVVDIGWTFAANHPGDCYLYLSYDTDKDEPENYFKIAEFPGCVDKTVFDNAFDGKSPPAEITEHKWPVLLPEWLASCDHCVLRWEWVSVQQVSNNEYYASCADVKITGTSEAHDAFLQKVNPIVSISGPFGHMPDTTAPCSAENYGNCYRRAYDCEFGDRKYLLSSPEIATFEGVLAPPSPPQQFPNACSGPLPSPSTSPSPSPSASPSPSPSVSPSPSPSVSPSPIPSVSPSPNPSSSPSPCDMSISYYTSNTWIGGFQGTIALSPYTQDVEIIVDYAGTDVSVYEAWNGELVSSSGSTYVMRTASWDAGAISFNAYGTSQSPLSITCASSVSPSPSPATSPSPSPSASPSPSPSTSPSPSPSISPSPSPSTSPSPSPTPSPAPSPAACDMSISYSTTSTYDGGFQGAISLSPYTQNTEIIVDYTGTDVSVYEAWNGNLVSSSGSTYALRTASWNAGAISFIAYGTPQAPVSITCVSSVSPSPSPSTSPGPSPSPSTSPSPSPSPSPSTSPSPSPSPSPSLSPSPSPSASPSPSPAVSPSPPREGRVVQYFVNWGIYARNFKPWDMQLDSITHVHYSFFDVTQTCEVATLDQWSDWDIVYPELGMSWEDPPEVTHGNIGAFQILRAQHPHIKVAISLGGWTKSNHFSGCAADPTKRANLVASAMDVLARSEFDGIDVDWEYPVCCGESDNEVNADDWANYVTLLQDMRTAMDARWPTRHMELTVAMGMGPSVSGVAPMEELANVLDAVNLMTYDYNGAWKNTIAHNAPLQNDPSFVAAGGDSRFNINWGVDLWLSRVPANKLVLGMPAYGRGWASTAAQPTEYSEGTGAAPGTWEAGTYAYWDIAASYLSQPGVYTRGWNEISKVPYLHGNGIFISYDDEESIRIKAEYARDRGLAGHMWWEASDDRDGVLLAAANAAFGSGGGSGRRRLAASLQQVPSGTPAAMVSRHVKISSSSLSIAVLALAVAAVGAFATTRHITHAKAAFQDLADRNDGIPNASEGERLRNSHDECVIDVSNA